MNFIRKRAREGVRNPSPRIFNTNVHVGFFDGSSREAGRKCGVGVVLRLNYTKVFKLKMGCWRGTYTRGELLTLWYLLDFARTKQIFHLQVCGDYKIVIDWMARNCRLQGTTLKGWKRKIILLLTEFNQVDSQNICR